MKKINLLIIFIIIIAICSLYAVITNGEMILRCVGVPNFDLSYENILAKNGRPDSEESMGETKYIVYSDRTYVFQGNDFLTRVEITGRSRRISGRSIGIGSKKCKVELLYSLKKKIKDLPEGGFGFIDNDVWVRFEFDDRNCVNKISVYYGP